MDTESLCSVCKKESGICICTGCNERYCIGHFTEHRQSLEGELLKLVGIRDSFQDDVNKKEQMNSLQSTLLSQIDEWQNQIMKKVHQSADEARNQVKELLLNKIKDVEQELEEITKQLQKLQETKNYVEKNIKLIEENFGLLREKFSRITEPPSIKLDVERTKQIDWSSLIYVDNAEKKVNVHCSSAHIKCPWLGLQNQLEDHLKTCTFEPLRLKIETLNKQTKEQKTQIENYNTEIQRLNVQLQQCHDLILQYTHEIDQLKKEREQLKTQTCNNESDIQLIKTSIQQLRIEAKEKEQKQQFAPPGVYQILRCKGRHCANCGKCRDWYYTGDLETWQWIQNYKNWGDKDRQRWRSDRITERFKRRDGAACAFPDFFYGRHPHCLCDDNIKN